MAASVELYVSSNRRFRVQSVEPGDTPALPSAAAARLERAFADGQGAGLLHIAAVDGKTSLPPGLAFARRFAQRYLTQACHLGDVAVPEAGEPLPAPPGEELSALTLEAPPMRGLEYLDAQTFRDAWRDMDERVRRDIGESGNSEPGRQRSGAATARAFEFEPDALAKQQLQCIIHAMIPRLLEHRLASAWKQFPVVVLTGARQVGKTTLARHFQPNASYVTLDVPAEAELARLNASELFEARPAPMILDEVQYAPSLLRELKVRVDRHRAAGQYLLTGSQSFEVMAGVSESLAGRAAILTLPALSLRELADASGLAAIDAALWRGSYPQLWQQPQLDRELWLGSYLATYLERDVRNLLAVGSLRDFDRLLRACALRAGQILSYAELARDIGVAPNTVKSWISVLEASQQIFLLEPYHRARTKRLVKSPKLYFCDSGLLTYLMGFTAASELPRHALWGAVWENFVVSEIRKGFLIRGLRPPLWFWRTSSGDELDILIELAPERFVVIECKTAAQVSATELRSLRPLRAEYGAGCVAKAFIACRTERAYPLAEEGAIEAVPLAGRGGLLTREELAGSADG